MQQLREALKILAERVLILEHMIGVHGRTKNRGAGNGFSSKGPRNERFGDVCWIGLQGALR